MSPANPSVPRHAVVQAILNLYTEPSYLEIGVRAGTTFNKILARRKVAVDPEFKFEPVDSATELLEITHHACTSDDYFGRLVAPSTFFDVVFIDGLHSFEQTLRDLMNSIACLKPGGAIIIDDVIPNSLPASLPDEAACKALKAALAPSEPHLQNENSWMGDVFKLVFYVETFLQMFSYATVRENHGQLILWRQPRHAAVPRRMEAIARLTFEDTVFQRGVFNVQPMSEILAAVDKTLAGIPAPRAARPSGIGLADLNSRFTAAAGSSGQGSGKISALRRRLGRFVRK